MTINDNVEVGCLCSMVEGIASDGQHTAQRFIPNTTVGSETLLPGEVVKGPTGNAQADSLVPT